VKSGRKVTLVKTSEIDWIDSASNYAQLHARGHCYLLRMTMGELETKLDPRCFVRVHRTAIVNIERVQEIDFGTRGDFSVKLHNGTSLRLSPRYRDSLWRSDHLGLSRTTDAREREEHDP
jgi:two-component system LytT family response regulator